MSIIPFAPVERVIREAGAKRVSESAGVALADILEQHGHKIAKEAVRLANHAGRKTIRAEDIELAFDMMISKGE